MMIIILMTINLEPSISWPNFYEWWLLGFYTWLALGSLMMIQLTIGKLKRIMLTSSVWFRQKSLFRAAKNKTVSLKKFRLEIVQWQNGGIQMGFNVDKEVDIDELGSVLYTALFTLQKKDPLLHRLLLYYTLETLSKRQDSVALVKEYLQQTEDFEKKS